MACHRARVPAAIAIWAASTCFATADDVQDKTVNRDQAKSSETLASVIDGWFHCDMIEPMVGIDEHSPVRPGAVLSGVNIFKYQKKFAGFNLADADHTCTPKMARPASVPMPKTLTYNYKASADASLTLEIEKLITGISLSAEYLDQVSIKITDSALYFQEDDEITDAINSIKARPKCGNVFKTSATKANFLSSPIVVKNACVGKVSLDYKWKTGVHAGFLQAQLGSLKIGFSSNFELTNLNEVPCPPAPAKADAKQGGDTPAAKGKSGDTATKKGESGIPAASGASDKPTGSTETNAQIKEILVAGLNALATYLKKVADEAAAKGAPDAPAKAAAATKAKADADAAASKPSSAATADSGKCYDGYSLASEIPVVFGVTYRSPKMYVQ